MRLKVKILVLVSMHETESKNSHSRLEARDWWEKISLSSENMRLSDQILILVSKHETEGQKFSILSRSMRLKGRNSRSRLKAWDWKEEVLDLVSRVQKGLSPCSAAKCPWPQLVAQRDDLCIWISFVIINVLPQPWLASGPYTTIQEARFIVTCLSHLLTVAYERTAGWK